MAVQGLGVSLTTTATLIAGEGIHGVIRVHVRNRGTGTAYLGSSSVTTGTAYQMTSADAQMMVLLVGGETLYGTSTGASVLDVLRLNDTTSS